MAGEWETTLLRDLLVTTKDGDWGKENPEDGYVPYHIIRGTDFPDVRVGDLSSVPQRYLPEHTVKRRTLEPDDILIETAGGTRDRPTGRTLLITEKVLSRFRGPVTCASFARFLRIDRKQADPRFVFWYLQHLYDKGEMSQHQVQHTGVARFQYTRFAETQNVPLPPLAEQKAIAAVLGALDDKIELNRRMNATLEAMARALFRSWFIDFDPVRRNADRPQNQPSPAASRHPLPEGEGWGEGSVEALDRLFPDSFQDSSLGHIPQGWEVGRLGKYLETEIGGDWGEDDRFDGAVEVAALRGVDLEHLRERGDANPPHRWIKESSLAKRRMSSRDVLVASSGAGPCGRPLWVSSHLEAAFDVPLLYSNFCKRYRAATPAHALYFDRVLFEMRASGEIWDFINGTSLPNLDSKGLMSGKSVLVPPVEILEEFASFVKPIYQRLYSRESRTLDTLRDTLLPKLLGGELSVTELQTTLV